MELSHDAAWWLMGVVIVIILYLTWRGRRERRSERAREAQATIAAEILGPLAEKLKPQDVQRIVDEWGAFLQDSDLGLNEVRDASELPVEKDNIEAACLKAIALSADDVDVQEKIIASLMSLAQFQFGVGPVPAVAKTGAIGEILRDSPPAEQMSNTELTEHAKRIAANAGQDDDKRHRELWAKVEGDQIRLQAAVNEIKIK